MTPEHFNQRGLTLTLEMRSPAAEWMAGLINAPGSMVLGWLEDTVIKRPFCVFLASYRPGWVVVSSFAHGRGTYALEVFSPSGRDIAENVGREEGEESDVWSWGVDRLASKASLLKG